MSDHLSEILSGSGRKWCDNDAAEAERRHWITQLTDCWPNQMKTIVREINDELFHYDYNVRIDDPSTGDSRNGATHIIAHAVNRRGKNGHVLARLTMQLVGRNTMAVGIYTARCWTMDTPPEKKIGVLALRDSHLPEQAIKRYLDEFVNWCLQEQWRME